MIVITRYACQCGENNFRNLFELRTHWRRDHGWDVLIRVVDR